MSILPRCTCDEFGSIFGHYDERCPRHRSSALWWKQKLEERAAKLAALRQTALTRPVHGGYPSVVDQPLNTTPVVDQKQVILTGNGSGIQPTYRWVERCRHPGNCIKPQCGDFCHDAEPVSGVEDKTK